MAKWGLLPLRLVVGIAFMMHGGQKAFVFGIAGTTRAFTQMGVPLPGVTGPLIMALELFGGIALIFGLFTRYVAPALACDMAGAVLMVRMEGGYFAPRGGEYEILLCVAAVTLALLGAGDISLDKLVRKKS